MTSWISALFTSDSALVRCELDRIRDSSHTDGSYAAVGAWSDDMVVQRRYGAGSDRAEVWEAPDSEVVMLVSGELPLEVPPDTHAMPYRFHQWLFCDVGQVSRADAVRDRLYEELPEFLQGLVRGQGLGEVLFGHFLAGLRNLGRIDDPHLEPVHAARALKAVAASVEQTSRAVGGTEKSRLALITSNGQCLAASRLGAQHLGYRLLEGTSACRRCGLAADEPESSFRVRDHRRRRSVVVSTLPQVAGPDLVCPDGKALAIGRQLAVEVV